MSILHDIYEGEYSPDKALEKMPFALRLKRRVLLDAIEEGMGTDFIERHWDSLCQLEDFVCYTSFREGFRLGASLMLELR